MVHSPPVRPVRRFLRIAAGTSVILALLLIVAWTLLPTLLSGMIERALRDAGFPHAEVGTVTLTLAAARIDRIMLSADGGSRAAGIRAAVSVDGLLKRRLDSLGIAEVRLSGVMDDNGIELAGYAPVPASLEPPMSELPVGLITIQRINLQLERESGAIHATLSGAEIAATTSGLTLRAEFDAGLPAGTVSGRLQGRAGLPLVSPGSQANGRMRVTLDATTFAGQSVPALQVDAALSGEQVDFAIRSTGREAIFADLAGSANLAAETLTLAGDAAYAGMPLNDLEIGIARTDGRYAVRLASAANSAIHLDLAGGIDMDGGQGSLTGEAEIPDLSALPPLSDGPVTAGRLRLASGDKDVPLVRYALNESGIAWWIDADMELESTLSIDTTEIDGLTLSGPLLVAGDGGKIRIGAPGCLRLAIARLKAARVGGKDMTFPCLRQTGDRPLLAHDTETGETAIVLQMPEAAIADRMTVSDRDFGLSGHWPAMTLSARLDGNGDAEADLSFDGGDIDIAEYPLRMAGLNGEIATEAWALSRFSLSLGRIVSTADPPLFTPLTLDIDAQAGADGPAGQMAYEAFLSDALGSVVIRADGKAGPESGTADLRLFPVQFVPGALEVGDISPWLADLVEVLEGEIGATAELAWSGEGVTRQIARMSLDDLAVSASGLAVEGLEATIGLDSMMPLSTASPQTIELRSMISPLPLSNGRLDFELAWPRMSVAGMDFTLTDGQVGIDPFTVDLSDVRNLVLTMRARNISLDGLFVLAGVDGLTGEGRLSGRLPLRIDTEGVHVENGILRTEQAGILRYAPETLPEFLRGDEMRTKMLRQALADFRYDALSLHIDGSTEGEQTIKLEVSGKNPDFLGGHPVELTFNLQGALMSTIRSAAALSRAEMFESLGGKPDMKPEKE